MRQRLWKKSEKGLKKRGKSDIIDWFNAYRDINKQNAALQETTNTSYQKGALKNDL